MQVQRSGKLLDMMQKGCSLNGLLCLLCKISLHRCIEEGRSSEAQIKACTGLKIWRSQLASIVIWKLRSQDTDAKMDLGRVQRFIIQM